MKKYKLSNIRIHDTIDNVLSFIERKNIIVNIVYCRNNTLFDLFNSSSKYMFPAVSMLRPYIYSDKKYEIDFSNSETENIPLAYTLGGTKMYYDVKLPESEGKDSSSRRGIIVRYIQVDLLVDIYVSLNMFNKINNDISSNKLKIKGHHSYTCDEIVSIMNE